MTIQKNNINSYTLRTMTSLVMDFDHVYITRQEITPVEEASNPVKTALGYHHKQSCYYSTSIGLYCSTQGWCWIRPLTSVTLAAYTALSGTMKAGQHGDCLGQFEIDFSISYNQSMKYIQQ